MLLLFYKLRLLFFQRFLLRLQLRILPVQILLLLLILHLVWVRTRLDLLGIFQIVVLEIDFGGEDLTMFVVDALDFHLEAGDEYSHCQLFSTGLEQSADLGYFGGVGQLKGELGTAPKA